VTPAPRRGAGLDAIRLDGFTRGAFLLRSVLAASALYGAAAAGPALTRALGHAKHGAFGGGDLGIANFALDLERIEGQFYKEALAVKGLHEDTRKLLESIAANEAEHAKALTQTITQLGGKPDPAETVKFPSFGDEQAVLDFAVKLEDTGVAAYNGAATQIVSKDLLLAVASIAQVEGRHAGALRTQAGQPPSAGAFEKVLSGEQADDAVHGLTSG
jgi:rubrerythrin